MGMTLEDIGKDIDVAYLEKIRAQKQVALHIHMDGSILAEDLFELSQKKGMVLRLPETDIDGKRIAYPSEEDRMISSPQQLKEFLTSRRRYRIVDVFSVATSLMQTTDDIFQMAVSHCYYLRSQNIVYAESRIAPQYHLRRGLYIDQVIEAVIAGLEQGHCETSNVYGDGVFVKPIISIGREAGPSLSRQVVINALMYKHLIAGIDLACEETGNPPEQHREAFGLAEKMSIRRTVHAGEMCSTDENQKNIYTSLDCLSADGLGHAIPLWRRYHDGIDLWDLVRRRDVRIESNPISNLALGFIDDLDELHLDELVNAGLLVTINPDDPAMWENGDLYYNLYCMGKMYGDGFVRKVRENAIKAAWGLMEKDKKKMLKDIEKDYI